MKTFILSVILFFFSESLAAQVLVGGGGEANPDLKTNVQALKNWQALRFGLFIHWGPVTLRGTEIGWSRGREVPIEEYDNLYKEFNPVLFNAKEWVAAAKAAGMKYLIITSKHHDGFCLWDSKYTDYDIMSSPFKRDVLKELAEECKRQDILFGTYYSILDWHHPDYTTRHGGDPRPVGQSDMNRYIVYLKNQIRELIEIYHTNILWFDGEWEDSWDHEKGMDLYRYARGLRDDILINNRVDKGRKDMQGMTLSQKFAGDFGTPEQRVGAFEIERPWESCITICRQWAWKPNDRMKSLRECIQTLAKTAGGGGNLLLNVSPMLDGRIEQRQIDRLRGMGEWLKKNGESIYGTQGGPFKPTDWMVSTRKGNQIFIHLFNWPGKELVLPELSGCQILSARLMGGREMKIMHRNGQIAIQLPPDPVDENDTVIVLKLDKESATIPPLNVTENIIRDLVSCRRRQLAT
ncbi:MAG: alpha-L-fucosidase [Calditrichaeota bacterium]|nr:alpha-L-fucosidase [Calditrichota bacterium]